MRLNYKFRNDVNSGLKLAEKGNLALSPINILDDARKGKTFGVSITKYTTKSVKVVLFSENECYRLSADDMRQNEKYKVVENHSGGFFKINKSQPMNAFLTMITNFIHDKDILRENKVYDFIVEFDTAETEKMFNYNE